MLIIENLRARPPVLIAELPWYTEGPVADTVGNIYFTTLKGEIIYKIDREGRLSEWAKGKCPNGQAILSNGDHLVCDSAWHSVTRYSGNGSLTGHDIEGSCAGETVYSPNDLVADDSGGVYFTDSVRHTGKVFYYHSQGDQKVIAKDLDFPNGIALSKNGKTLFVAESYQNRILRFQLDSAALPKAEVFAELPKHRSGNILNNLPDGIKVDREGNLWVAHYGMGAVHILTPGGKLLHSIKIDFPLASNLFLTGNNVLISGGYGEPGPGGIFKL